MTPADINSEKQKLDAMTTLYQLEEWKNTTPSWIRHHEQIDRHVGRTWKRLDKAWWAEREERIRNQSLTQ